MEIFGVVEKGEILAGKDADIVVIDNSVDWTIEPNELHSKCGWTIFEGTEIRGAVDKVFKGGDLVVDGVEFYGKKGSGREIGF
jgi:dihydroorotase-like cyclic amidohydrolase